MTCANFQVLEPGLGAATATVFTPAEINFPYDDTDELRLDIYNYQSEQWVNVPFATGAVIDVGGAGDRFYAWNLTTTNGQRGVTTIIADGGTTPALPGGETASHPLAPEAGTDYPVFNGGRVNVRLYRQTSIASGEMPAVFYPGASIRAEDLNDNFEALRKVVEEAACATNNLNDGAAQLDARYWNKIDVDLSGNTYTSASTAAWPDDDVTIATTAAGDDRWLTIPGGGGTTFTAGSGIELTGTPSTVIEVDLGASNPGLTFDGSDDLIVDEGDGIVLNANGVSVGAGTGITVNANDVAVTSRQMWGNAHDHSADVNGTITLGNGNNVVFPDNDGSNTVTLGVPDNVTENIVLNLPPAGPTATNRTLKASGTTTGAGTHELEWAADTNANTTYDFASAAVSGNARLRLSGSDSTNDDVLITAGTGVTFSNITSSGFTINSAGGGGGAEVVADVAALNTAADGPPSDGDLFLLLDSTNLQAAAGSAPNNEEAVNDLPETQADGQPVGGYGATIQVTLSWDNGNTRWQFVRWAVSLPDNRYVLEAGDTMTGNLLFNDGSDDNITLNTDGTASFAGNVGIGTTAPGRILDVNTTSQNVARFTSTSATAVGPNINLVHTSASPADDDQIGQINFQGNNDNSPAENIVYADLRALSTDVSDGAEKGALTFSTRNGDNYNEAMRIDSSGRLLVGTDTGSGPGLLIVEGGAGSSGADAVITLRRGGNNPISGTQGLGQIRFEDLSGGFGAQISALSDGTWSTTTDCPTALLFSTTAESEDDVTERMRINSSGNVEIGGTPGTSPNIELNASGSAEFKGDVNIDNFFIVDRQTDGDDGNFFISQFRNAAGVKCLVKGNGTFWGTSLTSANIETPTGTNAKILSDGSAEFSAKVETVGDDAAFHVGLAKDAQKVPFNIYDTDNSNATIAKINGDGTSTFAGRMDIGSDAVTDVALKLQSKQTSDASTLYIQQHGAAGKSLIIGVDKDNTHKVKINNDGSAQFGEHIDLAANGKLKLGKSNAANNATIEIVAGNGQTPSLYTLINGFQADNTTSAFDIKADGSATFAGDITANGTVLTSDQRLKTAIVDADPQWNDIKALKLRNYEFIAEPGVEKIGLIAQEVEATSPGLVDTQVTTNEETGEVESETKGIKFDPLVYKMLGALQSAMTRIETLESNTNPDMSSISELTNKVNAIEAENSLVATLVQNISARLDSIDEAITALQNPSTPAPEVNLIPDEWSQEQRIAAMHELLNEYNSNK